MLASPGMLQNGVSRSLLERWAPEAKNGVVITGYNVEGTMARQIQTEPDAIPAVMTRGLPGKRGGEERQMIPRRCTVQEFSFAAHVDGQENREFIEEVGAPVVILVHGEKHNMNRMKSRLLGLGKYKVFSPANCEEVRIPFRREKVARVVGRLAGEVGPLPSSADGEEGKRRREEAKVVSGVLVQNDFKLSLMAPEDLKEFAGLTTTTILCRQRITLAAAGAELVRWALEGTFGSVDTPDSHQTNGTKVEDETIFEIMGGAVRLVCRPHGETEMEWEGNATNDSIADAVMAVLLTVESSPAAVRQSSKLHNHGHDHDHGYDGFGGSPVEPNGFGDKKELALGKNPFANVNGEERLNRLFMFLEAQFGEEAITPMSQPKISSAPNGSSKAPTDGEEEEDEDEVAHSKATAAELARLHEQGIPVPGVEIKVDKMVARVWLERLEVECANKSLGDRVRAVVERAVETVAPLWQ